MLKRLLNKIDQKLMYRRNVKLLNANLNLGRGTDIQWTNLDIMFPQLIQIGERCTFAP